MADILKGLKSVWMRGMEAIGDTASNIANNTKYKVQEMNLINRRHEILSDFGQQAYALWQQGVQFPEELQLQLEELSKVDESLNTIRAERLAYLQTIEDEKNARAETENDDFAQEEAAPAAETTADEEADTEIPVMEMPVSEGEEADAEDAAVPTLAIPEAAQTAEKTSDDLFEDAIEQLIADDAPAAPEEPKEAENNLSEFEKKVGRALDTVQVKVSKLGKVIDRSVQNLAKVVLQNEEKQDKSKETNHKSEQ